MEGDVLQYGGRSPEYVDVSLDVKLAFSRLCGLIDSLKDDIGLEAASFQLQRIRNDAAKVLKRKRDRILAKEQGYQHTNELNSTNASMARLRGVDLQFPILHPHQSVQLGTIIEEKGLEVFDGTDSEHDYSEVTEEESNNESSYFFLKSWSIIKKCNDLLLSGDKINEKGEIVQRDFISKKIISRKDKDTIRTVDGEFVLMGLLTDKKKLIPIEVKNQFSEEKKFPRIWKKALELWIDLDKKKEKEEKAAKKIVFPKKNITVNKLKYKKTQEKHHKKSNIKKNQSVSYSDDTGKNTKIEKNKGEKKPVQKKSNRTSHVESCAQQRGTTKNLKRLGSDDVQEDPGPFSELLGDESLFVLPKSSLTPNQLLGSIKKNVIKGRYTPPTNMFDNVYGNKSDNNSSVNTSFDDVGVKNDPVIKRMSKVSNKTNNRKNNNKNPKCIVEDNETVNEILRAAKAKTNTTPSVIRQVFNTEIAEESVNFSDLSDVEVD